MTKLFSALCCFLALSGVAFSADEAPKVVSAPFADAAPIGPPAGIKPLEKQKMLQMIVKQGHDLQFDFIGRVDKTQVWMVSGPGAWQMIYLQDGVEDQAVVGGTLIDAKGIDQSIALQQKFVTEHAPRAAYLMKKRQEEMKKATAAQQAKTDLWSRLQQGGALTFGDAHKPQMIVFLDPDQAESRQIWQALAPKLQNGDIGVQLYAISWRSEPMIKQAAQLLGAKDPKAAWQEKMTGKTPAATKDVKDLEGVMQLKKNADLLQSLRLDATPVLFYRAQTERGEKTRLVRGVPKNWDALWSEIQKPEADAAK